MDDGEHSDLLLGHGPPVRGSLGLDPLEVFHVAPLIHLAVFVELGFLLVGVVVGVPEFSWAEDEFGAVLDDRGALDIELEGDLIGLMNPDLVGGDLVSALVSGLDVGGAQHKAGVDPGVIGVLHIEGLHHEGQVDVAVLDVLNVHNLGVGLGAVLGRVND